MNQREVRQVGRGVRFVAADDEIGLGAQKAEERLGQAGIAVEEDAAVPPAGDVEEDGREAVDGDEDRGPAGGDAGVQVAANRGVVRVEDLARAGGGFGG
jgi:hypothetical protein